MDVLEELWSYIDSAHRNDIHKAKKILSDADNDLDVSEQKNKYTVSVPSESRKAPYAVVIKVARDHLDIVCPCVAFEQYGGCKHALAAAMYLTDFLYDELFEDEDIDWVKTPGKKTAGSGTKTLRNAGDPFVFQMKNINVAQLRYLAGNATERELRSWADKAGEPVADDSRNFRFPVLAKKNLVLEVTVYFDGRDKFETSCTCREKVEQLCIHAASCFYSLFDRGEYRYFDQYKLFEEEKSLILKDYGLTPEDPEAKDFQWGVDLLGNLTMIQKPDYLQRIGDPAIFQEFRKILSENGADAYATVRPSLPETFMINYEIGVLFNFGSTRHIGFELELLQITDKNGKQKITKLKLIPSNYALLKPLPDKLYSAVLEFSEENLLSWVSQKGYGHVSIYYNPWSQVPADLNLPLRKHYATLLFKVWPLLLDNPHLFQIRENRFSQSSLKPARLGKQKIDVGFVVERTEKLISLFLKLSIEGEPVKGATMLLSGLIFEVDGTLYLPADPEIYSILYKFHQGRLSFPLAMLRDVLLNVILPLQQKYEVVIDGDLRYEAINPPAQLRVMLSEFNEQHLLVRPQAMYEDIVLDYDLDTEHVLEENGDLKVIKRDKAEEKKLYTFLRTLHPRFASQNNNQHYYIPFSEVMKNNWFFTMIKQIEAAGYPVYGIQELKKFRYNTFTPKINIEAGSGIDWFDLKINAQWGDQHVSLKDLRKAIVNRQESILLDDGSLGVIPQEWIRQYSTLLKLSHEQNGSLRISKLHFGLLDQLDALKNDTVLDEIAAKKAKLKDFTGAALSPVSSSLQATLRPYQLAGFQWMQTLDELAWGGCLADDMGLGKTLQTITFLQYIKEKRPGSTSLVVCPTSLLFNWENELQKFCPTLRYHTYYGLQRTFSQEHFEEYDLVLTSYGIVRNDLKELLDFEWQYVILDESQAIKNPEAQVTRAVSHLKAKNKLILSGTPVQNNTQDLYAQFNFLNPGMLGSREFFRGEFAQAIDRNENKEKVEQLRRLVSPFMLRRTKEQVAKDLPDKTETILWCSMGKAQRALYDEYKNHYRNLLLKKIDEEGISKAGIYVLEGLLRLRQICDHPQLVNDEEHTVKVTESVKSEELLREIQENTGTHKLLVFSQFTQMLQLIKKELQHHKISFCYLDGSTPAAKRRAQVEEFQADTSIKVFLISLKAGGVGLNLTAADYVYLVDPWWNPAAEQQAIDRTHRIGQTRKIFAYKMICKDSVEEKIVQLQQKKKALSQELVSEDESFTKNLTREDVAFLFS